MFFPPTREVVSRRVVREAVAKAACHRCLMLSECDGARGGHPGALEAWGGVGVGVGKIWFQPAVRTPSRMALFLAADYNAADLTFAQILIPHHEQATKMAVGDPGRCKWQTPSSCV